VKLVLMSPPSFPYEHKAEVKVNDVKYDGKDKNPPPSFLLCSRWWDDRHIELKKPLADITHVQRRLFFPSLLREYVKRQWNVVTDR